MAKFNPTPDFIRSFVLEYFGEYDERTNDYGEWIEVESPWRRRDRRLCLGFNMEGWVHDFFVGETWSFPHFVKEYFGIDSWPETIRFLIGFALEHSLFTPEMMVQSIIPTDRMPFQNAASNAVRSMPQQPVSQPVMLPEIDYPTGSIPISMENEDNSWSAKAASHLRKHYGFSQVDVDREQLRCCASGKYHGRIIIPVRDEYGRFVWFQGRTFIGTDPKYLNPVGDFKSQIVSGLHKVHHGERVVICEGIFDAKKVRGGCSVFGKTISLIQLSKIRERLTLRRRVNGQEEIHQGELILALDNDLPGVEGTLKAAKLLNDYNLDFKVVVFPSDVNDFGEMDAEEAEKLIEGAVPWLPNTSAWIKSALMASATQREMKSFRSKVVTDLTSNGGFVDRRKRTVEQRDDDISRINNFLSLNMKG